MRLTHWLSVVCSGNELVILDFIHWGAVLSSRFRALRILARAKSDVS